MVYHLKVVKLLRQKGMLMIALDIEIYVHVHVHVYEVGLDHCAVHAV